MKKLLACGMAISCLLLCACGSYRADNGTTPETMMPLESMMPNPEDGIVDDTDGVIEDTEENTEHTSMPGNTFRP